MSNRNASSTEQYTKKSNRFLLLSGVGIIVLLMLGYCVMSGGGNRPQGGETPIDFTSDVDPQLQGQAGQFDQFGVGSGQLEASTSKA